MPHVAHPVDGTELSSIGIDPPEQASRQELDRCGSWRPALPKTVLVLRVEVGTEPDQARHANLFLFRLSAQHSGRCRLPGKRGRFTFTLSASSSNSFGKPAILSPYCRR